MTELDFLPAPLNSRFQTYPSPVASPGKCAVCGAVDRPVLDFGMDIQFYGAVMFCFECMASAARIIDMVPRSELVAAEESLTQSFIEQLKAQDMVAISNERYCDILVAISGISDLLLPISFDSNDVVAVQTEPEPPSLFDDVAESVFGFNGIAEQEHDVAVGEGRTNVSRRNVDGIGTGFNL